MVSAFVSGRRTTVFGILILLVVTATFAVGAGRATADVEPNSVAVVSGGDAVSGGVVVGAAPEWPFRGFLVPHLGRFWDTGRGRVHDVGSQFDPWGNAPCDRDYLVIDGSAIRVQYWSGLSGATYGYVIPWGDIAYPVVNGRSTPLGSFDVSAQDEEVADASAPGRTPDLWAYRQVGVTHAYDVDYAVGDQGDSALDLLAGGNRRSSVGWSLAAFRLESAWNGEGFDPLPLSKPLRREHPLVGDGNVTGKWYLSQEKVRGFVEVPTVKPGQMDPEVAYEAVSDDRGRTPGGYFEVSIGGTDGRYYELTLTSHSEANCSFIYRTFVVDGASGEIVGCLDREYTETWQGLVFVAATQADRPEHLALPRAPEPVGLDACGYRLDASEPGGFPFTDVAPVGGEA